MRVLVVEDEAYLADAIQGGLQLESIAADVVRDGARALEAAALVKYDMVILDRDIPVIHGDDVCTLLIAQPDAPRILMLTAASTVGERVSGLSLGADDYLTKPFEFDELVARLIALYRRAPQAVPPTLVAGDPRVDLFRREAYRANRYLHLTRKEFAVLEVLMRSHGAL